MTSTLMEECRLQTPSEAQWCAHQAHSIARKMLRVYTSSESPSARSLVCTTQLRFGRQLEAQVLYHWAMVLGTLILCIEMKAKPYNPLWAKLRYFYASLQEPNLINEYDVNLVEELRQAFGDLVIRAKSQGLTVVLA